MWRGVHVCVPRLIRRPGRASSANRRGWVAGLAIALLAPLWAPVPAHAAQTYVVRVGDTLWRISHRLGVRPVALASANHLLLTSIIHPGLQLVVPAAPARVVEPAPDSPGQAVVRESEPAHGRLAVPVPSRSALTATRSGFSARVAALAMSFVGRPYAWSGLGPNGFDCSGLVARVYAAAGRLLPHSSFGQYALGAAVARDTLAAGDLVFFHTYDAGPSHVGIYVGNQQFVHASYSHGVIVSSLNDPYFFDRYVGARRP
jgi:cell wall-associated NlpC family hydrolase